MQRQVKFRKAMAAAAVAMAVGMLSACGGGGGSSAPAPTDPGSGSGSGSLAGNGGLWTGTVTSGHFSGYHILGISAHSGDTKFWLYSGLEGSRGAVLAPGAMTQFDTSFTAPYKGIGTGVLFPNGHSSEKGTLTGTVAQSSGDITGNYQSTDTGARQDKGVYALSFDQNYNSGSDLNTLLGNGGHYLFTAYIGGRSVSGGLQLAASGLSNSITGNDDGGCRYNGLIAPVDSKYDAYEVHMDRVCGGTTTHLSGLAAYYPLTSVLKLIVDDGAGAGAEIVAAP